MKKLILTMMLSATLMTAFAQEPVPEDKIFPRYNVGFGIGIDYGGVGGRFTILPTERFEFFAGVGYNLLTVGLNAGADIRFIPSSRICPYAGAMFGYNAVILVTGADEYNKTYYGPTFNLGVEFWGRQRPNFFNVEILLPIRSSAYKTDIEDLKNNSSIIFSSEPLPIGFSLGYHFSF